MNSFAYEAHIQWLFKQFPSYQKIGADAYKPSLSNTFTILEKLAIPLNQTDFIHVAGTNGKGSTSSLISSILQEGNYKTGLFTSPHLKDFRERIRVNGRMISRAYVLEFIQLVKNQDWDIHPSFFEITWAMALSYFIDQKCDIAVIETGLGGRLDATNVINPLVSVITSIGLDHTDLLGHTRQLIAGEKAGIIKYKTPVVTMSLDEEIKDTLLRFAELNNAELIEVDTEQHSNYWKKNELLAISVIQTLNKGQKYLLSDEHIQWGVDKVFENTGLKGRLQTIFEAPRIVVDGAHNEQGVKILFESFLSTVKKGQLYILYGAAKDKEVLKIIALFPKDAHIYFTSFNHDRAMQKEDWNKIISLEQEKNTFFEDPIIALETIKNTVNKEDTILVFGSFFLISEIL